MSCHILSRPLSQGQAHFSETHKIYMWVGVWMCVCVCDHTYPNTKNANVFLDRENSASCKRITWKSNNRTTKETCNVYLFKSMPSYKITKFYLQEPLITHDENLQFRWLGGHMFQDWPVSVISRIAKGKDMSWNTLRAISRKEHWLKAQQESRRKKWRQP